MTIMAHPTAEIPTWEMLPYECWFKFCMYMLPKCTTEKILQFCSRQQCSLHDPQRWHLQTQGTVQELLATLLSWTCPVKLWTITLQNSLAESLEGLSHETQKLWEELARVFSLSLVARPGDVHIDIHVEGLGEIVLSWVTSTFCSYTSLIVDLIILQTATPFNISCGQISTTQMTRHYHTWPAFYPGWRRATLVSFAFKLRISGQRTRNLGRSLMRPSCYEVETPRSQECLWDFVVPPMSLRGITSHMTSWTTFAVQCYRNALPKGSSFGALLDAATCVTCGGEYSHLTVDIGTEDLCIYLYSLVRKRFSRTGVA